MALGVEEASLRPILRFLGEDDATVRDQLLEQNPDILREFMIREIASAEDRRSLLASLSLQSARATYWKSRFRFRDQESSKSMFYFAVALLCLISLAFNQQAGESTSAD
jgi:hypothetical protein